MDKARTVALVFSGGVGLGAFHGGAYEAFTSSGMPFHWVAGSSTGAVTAALIAGTSPGERVAALRRYWRLGPGAQAGAPDPNRHALAWMQAIRSRLFGSAGHFHPRVTAPGLFDFQSFYDLAPTRERLNELIDFSRLNAGDPRVTIVVTDIQSGDPVLFDSQTQPIEIDHILASCGFLPEFAPVAIDGRWFGDGGLSLNAPFDPILEKAEPPLTAFIMDLYPRDGRTPDSLEAALERKSDLLFGNQTFQRLRYGVENRKLRLQLQDRAQSDEEIYLLSYRPGPEEAGPEKSFDLSKMAVAQRWRAGFLDMQQAADAHHAIEGIRYVRRPL